MPETVAVSVLTASPAVLSGTADSAGDKKIPASTSGLQEPRVNSLGLTFDEVEHFFNQPPRRKHLPVVCNAPL
jgi:hypothetical protein